MDTKKNTIKNVIIIISSIIFALIITFLCFSFLKQFSKPSESHTELNILKESAKEANISGLGLVDEGKVEEGLVYFQKALEYANTYNRKRDNRRSKISGALLSDAYNNIGYAYYLLDDYELSKENLEKALSIEPNDATEYSNMGNTYHSLFEYDEAMKNYDLAINQDSNANHAYYGKGSIYYEQSDYENALGMFETYLTNIPDDVDAILYVIYCHLYLGNSDKALELVNQAIKDHDTDIDFYIAKCEIYAETKSYKDTREYNEYVATLFLNDVDMQINLGEFYYNNKEYQIALEQFLATKEQFHNNAEIDSWVISCYSALNDIDGASTYFQRVADAGKATTELCNDIGNVYINSTLYMESIPYFEKAIRLDPESQDAYLNMIHSLYYGKRYSRCIELAKKTEEKFSTVYDIPAFMGDSYYAMGQYYSAISAYKRALELSPMDDSLLSIIGDSYLLLEDMTNAEKFAEEALIINPDNVTAQNTKDTINSRQKSIGSQIKVFIKSNYLYYATEEELDEKIDQLFDKEDMTNLDIAYAVDEMRLSEDLFTFTLFDEYYDEYYNVTSDDVKYQDYGDISYIRIYGFNINTDSKVIEILDSIEDSKNKILAIDLRGNSGGLLQGAANILDTMLSDCTTCTIFDGYGYNYNYYSDASQIKFKKIFVLVDENSASASELLALGLRTYLDNVTIIGRNTFGKGVGQIAYEVKERKLIVFLVNFYWNVRQQNIAGSNIAPDIYMKTDDLEAYLKKMRQ